MRLGRFLLPWRVDSGGDKADRNDFTCKCFDMSLEDLNTIEKNNVKICHKKNRRMSSYSKVKNIL